MKLDELKPQHTQEEVASVEEAVIQEEKKKYLAQAIAKIGERCRRILKLYGLNYSMDEIAQELGLKNAEMAKKATYRCRNRLRDFLDSNPEWKTLIS